MKADAAAVLAFWFDEVGPERHFAKDDMLDAECARRFGALRDAVIDEEAAGWRTTANDMLAAIIVIDQFGRNMFRGSADAFNADPLALELALSAIAASFDQAIPVDRSAFVYLPLMHCEDLGVQRFSIRCFDQPGLERNLEFAKQHRVVIERFGRFPGRNAALGRTSSREELEWLAEEGHGW